MKTQGKFGKFISIPGTEQTMEYSGYWKSRTRKYSFYSLCVCFILLLGISYLEATSQHATHKDYKDLHGSINTDEV